MIEAALHARVSHGLEQAQRSAGDDIGSEFRHLEADLDVALRTEVVDLVGASIVKERGERTPVRQVGVVEEEARSGLVEVPIDVVEPVGVQAGGAALQAVDLIAFGKKELGEVGAVLAGATGD